MKRRQRSFNTTEARFKAIENHLRDNKVRSFQELLRTTKGNGLLYPFLKKNKIVIIDNEACLRWNTMIPITGKLVNSYLDYVDTYYNSRKTTDKPVKTRTRTIKSTKAINKKGTSSVKHKKEISLFWGLVKFSL